MLQSSRRDRLICQAQVFSVAPRAAADPALKARPVLYARICVGDGDGNRWRNEFFRWQLIAPFGHVGSESIFVHPVHKRGEVGRIAGSKWRHSFQQKPKFFFIEFSIEVQTEQVIDECDLRGHLKLLRIIVRRGEVVVRHGVIQQCSQRAGSKRCDLAEPLEALAGCCAFSRIGGMNLQNSEIKLVKIVTRLPLYCSSELFLLLNKIPLRAG